jgi:hypothetical protein
MSELRGKSHPNPGSDAAIEQGCICPVMDNWRGSDEIGRIRGFVVVVGCPLHSAAPSKADAPESAARSGENGPHGRKDVTT